MRKVIATIPNGSEQFPVETKRQVPPKSDNESPLPWGFRVFATALFWLLPGILFGLLLDLLFDTGRSVALLFAAIGGVVAMIAGGTLEAEWW